MQVPQVDTVEDGRGDRRVFLTAVFLASGFMGLLPGKCAQHVIDAFGWLWRTLGAETFRRLFPAVLKDNGTEYSCRTPYERFAFEHGEDVARKLGIVPIPLKEVTLRPELLEVK